MQAKWGQVFRSLLKRRSALCISFTRPGERDIRDAVLLPVPASWVSVLTRPPGTINSPIQSGAFAAVAALRAATLRLADMD